MRQTAGLFDVSHMGCWDVSGPEAAAFLNLVMVNDVYTLEVGQSQYSAFFDVDGIPMDDLMVYRMGEEHYLVVVNASNNDKAWAWVQAVLKGEALLDSFPSVWSVGPRRVGVVVRDLRARFAGEDCRAELALQGRSRRISCYALGGSEADLAKIKALPWARRHSRDVGGVRPDRDAHGYNRRAGGLRTFRPSRPAWWTSGRCLLAVGEPLGLKPCGLAARDKPAHRRPGCRCTAM